MPQFHVLVVREVHQWVWCRDCTEEEAKTRWWDFVTHVSDEYPQEAAVRDIYEVEPFKQLGEAVVEEAVKFNRVDELHREIDFHKKCIESLTDTLVQLRNEAFVTSSEEKEG